MSRYEEVKEDLRLRPRTWLVTGVAGFIGSNLLDALLDLGQTVVGMDNFATGHARNLDDALRGDPDRLCRFRFLEADIRDPEACREACRGVDHVLHHAALGSVPLSMEQPLLANDVNVNGFLAVLSAARDAGTRRFVYAASCAVYGDDPSLPKTEDAVGRALSPYAVTKHVNELYAGVFQRSYGIPTVGLRYFNIFGRRQDPEGPYAAVIPIWVRNLLTGEPCAINGDGENSRDFCYVENVVQANLLAATAPDEATGEVYNVACGERTTLNRLFGLIRDGLARHHPSLGEVRPLYREARPGDIRESQADITRIRARLGFEPTHSVADGLHEALAWYAEDLARGETLPLDEPAAGAVAVA
ncbi:MAG TPA: SDR family oxidoreductase [Longimicrobiaceae bacterium]|nr:SDR family oxidoreductase [Longimicrobiaceae bacterium]